MRALFSSSLFACLAGAAVAQPQVEPLRLVFERNTTPGQAYLDAGTLGAAPGSRRGVAWQRRITLRIEGAGIAESSARLWVSLPVPAPGMSVRVDGSPVGQVPVLIDAAHPLGADVSHLIEVAVPPESDAGAFAWDLVWTAETD